MVDELDGRERREKSQWSIDSWSALQSAATILMMAVAGLIWGLKLESRIDMISSAHQADTEKFAGKILALEVVTQKGILPVTEVRLQSLEGQINTLQRDIDTCMGRKEIVNGRR